AMALGYEDLNDHDDLRHDPVLAVLAGKLSARRKDCAPVAGKSTLNRLELSRPDPKHVSTSFAERNNLNIRMHSRRFTRLTNAFSKKVENHALAVALHTMYYNFVRIHQTLRTTPAMAAGVTKRLWEMTDLVDMLEPSRRVTMNGR